MYEKYDRLAIVHIGDYKIVTKVQNKLIFHNLLRQTYMYVNQANGTATNTVPTYIYYVLER